MKRVDLDTSVMAIWAVLPISALFPMLASAHHSPNVHFDRNDVQEISGTLIAIEWGNPHVQMSVEVSDENDNVVVWQVEEAGPNFQLRRGLSESDYEVGAPIRVAGFRGRRNPTALFATNTLLPDGRELVFEQFAEPRWSQELVPSEAVFRAANVRDTTSEATGLFRVWRTDRTYRVPDGSGRALWNESYPLTEEARATQANWDQITQNPFIFCQNGLPAIMDSAHPMEITRAGGDILIRLEEQDVVRRIHMNEEQTSVMPSPYGHSVGRFEDDTLVVITTDVDFAWFDQTGIPQSEALRLVERFEVIEDGRYLNYSVTATDPAVFTEPVLLEKRWVWLPGDEIKPYECSYDRRDL